MHTCLAPTWVVPLVCLVFSRVYSPLTLPHTLPSMPTHKSRAARRLQLQWAGVMTEDENADEGNANVVSGSGGGNVFPGHNTECVNVCQVQDGNAISEGGSLYSGHSVECENVGQSQCSNAISGGIIGVQECAISGGNTYSRRMLCKDDTSSFLESARVGTIGESPTAGRAKLDSWCLLFS